MINDIYLLSTDTCVPDLHNIASFAVFITPFDNNITTNLNTFLNPTLSSLSYSNYNQDIIYYKEAMITL